MKGNVDIKLLCEKLGNDTSKALLALHALTGCDTTGKFEGKSKQFWFRRFLAIDQHNTNLVKGLADFQESNESTEKIKRVGHYSRVGHYFFKKFKSGTLFRVGHYSRLGH